MEVGDLRKQGFSPDSIIGLTVKKVDYDAQDKISFVLAEIEHKRKNSQPQHIDSYGILLVPNPQSDLPLKKRWEALEAEISIMPKLPESIDKDEMERLTRSFTRLGILRRLGFPMRDDAVSYTIIPWAQNNLDNNAVFEIAQAPKLKRVFVVRTSMPAVNELVEVREDLLVAKDLNQAKEYWKNRILKGRSDPQPPQNPQP